MTHLGTSLSCRRAAALAVAGFGLVGFNVACDNNRATAQADEASAFIVPVVQQSEQREARVAESEGEITIRKAAATEQVMLGTQTQYAIEFANTSGGAVNNLIIREELPDGFNFESSQPEATRQEGNVLMFRVPEMRDGDRGTITITGTPQQVGDLQACTTYEFDRGICSVLTVVNPDLRLEKRLVGEGPFSVCTATEVLYVLTNDGETAAENVMLMAELPEGMTFAEGRQNRLEQEIGTVEPGETIEARVMIKADRAGTFRSSGVARSELMEVRSDNVELAFLAPQLELSAAPDGPYTFIGEPARFQVNVRNAGRVVADRVTLAAAVGQDANVRRMYVADEDRAEDGSIVIGTLQPGQSRTVFVDVETPTEAANVRFGAVAQAVCRDSGTELSRAEATAAIEVRTISALQVSVVDKNDPVRVGERTVYEINVVNEGSGDDRNLRIAAQIPQGLQFVGAEGPTEVQADGQNLSFTPIEVFRSGERATWYVTVEAVEAAGPVIFRVQVSSEATGDEAVVSEEPTRLF